MSTASSSVLFSIPDEAAVESDDCSAWVWDARERFLEIAALPDGWDSQGGEALDRRVLLAAWAFLLRLASHCGIGRPYIHPTPGGGVLLEWENEPRFLAVEVFDEGRGEWYYRDRVQREETEGEFSLADSPDRVVELIVRVAASPGEPEA